MPDLLPPDHPSFDWVNTLPSGISKTTDDSGAPLYTNIGASPQSDLEAGIRAQTVKPMSQAEAAAAVAAQNAPINAAKSALVDADTLSRTSGIDRINEDTKAAQVQARAQSVADNPVASMLGMAGPAVSRYGQTLGKDAASLVSAFLMPHTASEFTPGGTNETDQAVKEAFAHPSEIGPAFLQGAADPNVTAEAAARLGETALAEKPEMVPNALGATSRVVGKGIGAIGEGATALGEGLSKSKIGGFSAPGVAAAEAILHANPWAAAGAAVPSVLKGVGKAANVVGAGLEALPTRLSTAIDALRYGPYTAAPNPNGASPGWVSQATNVMNLNPPNPTWGAAASPTGGVQTQPLSVRPPVVGPVWGAAAQPPINVETRPSIAALQNAKLPKGTKLPASWAKLVKP